MKHAISFAALAASACLLIGCNSRLSYRQIELGDRPQQYKTLLPAASTRNTDLGQAHIQVAGLDGHSVAVVTILTETRLVAGKLLIEEHPSPGVTLRAEVALDRQLYSVEQTGPLDTLRLLAGDLAEPVADPDARRAHDFALGAVLRMIDTWPGTDQITLPTADVPGLLAAIPEGGTLAVDVTPRTLVFMYAVSK